MEKKLKLILKIIQAVIPILLIEIERIERKKENELSKNRLEKSIESDADDSRSGAANFIQE